MPSVDEHAKGWQTDIAERVGKAVNARRKTLGWTALQLANRTKELGYPVSRGAVARIESNSRVGKMDVAEIMVLGAALQIPPALLLFPDFPGGIVDGKQVGSVELLPDDRQASSRDAVKWFAGETRLPARRVDLADPVNAPDEPVNPGVQLVLAVAQREQISAEHLDAVIKSAKPGPEQASWKQIVAERTEALVQLGGQIARLQQTLGVATTKE